MGEALEHRNWFDQGGQGYARYRPHYPEALAAFLAGLVFDRRLAVDVGCGNGQLTGLLAGHFQAVLGVDPSADQLAHAELHPGIRYQCAAAEQLPLEAGQASLVTAAQAAHWFHLPAFYAEVRRVCRPGGVLALISYGVPDLEPELDGRFKSFCREEIGPWWPAERKLVDEGYASLDFPFAELAAPPLAICLEWDLAGLLGYLSTWSAVRQAREAGRENLLRDYGEALRQSWGPPSRQRRIRWPIHMRVGRV